MTNADYYRGLAEDCLFAAGQSSAKDVSHTRTSRLSVEFARLWFSPHHGRGKCCKRMVVQAHRVAFSLGRKMQDAACELVGPHFFNAVAFERQPSLIERCFQDRERLGIKRSAAKSTHVPSLSQNLAGSGKRRNSC